MNNTTRRITGLVLASGLALTACGGPRTVTDDDRALARMEGVFQCDVSRFAFDDIADIDARLDAALAEAAADRGDYRDFKSFLAESVELQALVSESYAARC